VIEWEMSLGEKMTNIYKPEILNEVKVSGITISTIGVGEFGKVLVKAFITSYEKRFSKYAKNILSLFKQLHLDSINRLLVIIKPDFKAYVYQNFPESILVRVKNSVKKGSVLNRNNIADILKVEFKDSVCEIQYEDGDQIIWLFRSKFVFGLYFDFSCKMEKKSLPYLLGKSYQSIIYRNIFEFLSNEVNFTNILNDGWFPFIRLVGDEFEHLMNYYKEDMKYKSYINDIINKYTKEVIDSIYSSWLKNQIFLDKKEMIYAGLEAYYQDTISGYINCIKNLITEAEGIIREACFRITGKKKPTIKEIKKFVIDTATKKFSGTDSIGFPKLFSKYLDEEVFKDFDISKMKNKPSRHTVAHGIAKLDNYTKIKAFQTILLLDQINFFLN